MQTCTVARTCSPQCVLHATAPGDEGGLLESLVVRATALKAEWDRQRDRERDRPQEARSAGPPAIDWRKAPWRCARQGAAAREG
jgi:hypothetical protein